MPRDTLILTPFRRTLEALEEVIQVEKTDVVRDATIQRFKCTYELAWKMIRRDLEKFEDLTSQNLANRRELFREAAEAGLIEDSERWFDYHRTRTETPLTHNGPKAEEIYEMAVRFAPEARALLGELSKIHD